MASVVDDHLLLDLLTGTASGWLAREATSAAIYTTSSWYYRVASAAETAPAKARCRVASHPFLIKINVVCRNA